MEVFPIGVTNVTLPKYGNIRLLHVCDLSVCVCVCVGMATTIAGRRWRRVFTTCSEVRGGWTSMERWSSITWTSALVNSPSSRYLLPYPPLLAPVIMTSFPSTLLFRQAIGAPRSILSMAMCTTVMGSKFVTCLVPGTRPYSAGKILTLPSACGELVSLILFQNKWIWKTEQCIVAHARKILCSLSPFSWAFFPAAPMPEDYEQYFSFGQFAIELNELEEGLKDKLPQTDCRFRPDQR